ncbi:hypothetical protein [Cohnella sp. GCM10012308]|uniref:hypothetical protein n=1 Tax=Cohnella sp. GCM10012308 TaxID=3317329 RepID=UPI003620356F
MTYRYRSLGLTALVAIVLATVLFYGLSYMNNRTHTDQDEAIATNIEVAILNAPLVITGKVIDGKGEPRNLRRDVSDPTKENQEVVVPGTDYRVLVSKVLKGELMAGDEIKIAIGGGNYRNAKAPLRATLVAGEEYIFTIAQSGAGGPNYYGIIEPFIYQLKEGRIIAVSNIEKYKNAFQETAMSEEEFYSKFK